MRSSTINTPRFNRQELEIPLDVQLMNLSARLLMLVASVALVVWSLLGVMRLPIFTLRSIDIVGDTGRYTPTMMRTSVLPQLHGNFFTIDLAQAQAHFESLPWIRHAIVRRIWPNHLLVSLEEHRAAAVWHREDEDDQLVNTEGEVFDANVDDVDDAKLPNFTGPEQSAARILQMYKTLNEVLAPLNAHIDALQLSDRGSWSVILDTGATLELGRGDDASVIGRTQNFMATVEQVLQHYKQALEYADLRYPKGYALRLHGVSTSGASPNQPL